MRKRYRRYLTGLLAALLIFSGKTEVYAASGTVTFGSESYQWNVAEYSPIGVYLEAGVPIAEYEICLEYNPDVLRYEEGASEVVENKIYIRGVGSSTRYKTMLYFTPLQDTETDIRVIGASAVTIGDVSNNIPSEAIEMTLLSVAPITVGETKQMEEVTEEPEDTTQTEEPPVIEKVPEEPAQPTEPNKQPSEKEKQLPQKVEAEKNTKPEQRPEQEPEKEDGMNSVLKAGVLAVCLMILMYGITKGKKRQKSGVQEEKNTGFVREELRFIDLERTVIDIQDVTMRFRLAQEEASSLKEYLIRAVKGQNKYRTLTALNHISFSIQQGDVVGIIGTNGSGKSTLLKIVSGALAPSEGMVLVDRSKVQMLTLGTGFDMELTAKENVYLNGAIIGYSREYIDEKYDEIVKFAELDGFMDERMKNFSSGMVSRLGFAIATMRDTPDILILDEVLSVGDMFFKQKSEKRIKEMIHSGATVIIVSHSLDTIQKNCNKAVWIEKGDMRMIGTPKEVCDAYRKQNQAENI